MRQKTLDEVWLHKERSIHQEIVLDTENKSVHKKLKVKKEIKNDPGTMPEDLVKVLRTLVVQLQHEVPPQHMIENGSGARHLDQTQIEKFEQYGPLKKGPFTKEEDDVIEKNWEKFCYIHEWDKNIVSPFLSMRHNGKYFIPALCERRKFLQFLANGLPWRCLYSVYYRFRNLHLTTIKHGPFTEKEDKKILKYMKKASKTEKENTYAKLAKVLNRKRHSIWLRYQKLKEIYNLDVTSDDETKKEKEEHSKKKNDSVEKKKTLSQFKNRAKVFTDIKWTTPLVKNFIDLILKTTVSKDLVELKNQMIDSKVWKIMERKIHIDSNLLRDFWYLQLHMQLFSPSPVYLNDTKVELIEYMYENRAKFSEHIDWESICINFDGLTPLFLSKLLKQLVGYAQKNIHSSNLNDALEYLHKCYVPVLAKKSIDAILPKLLYCDGKIICIDKGSENRIPNKFTINPFCDHNNEF